MFVCFVEGCLFVSGVFKRMHVSSEFHQSVYLDGKLCSTGNVLFFSFP